MKLRFVFLRLFFYCVVTFGVFGIIAFSGNRLDQPRMFQENGPIEWLQFALVIASACCCFAISRLSRADQALFRVFTLMLLCAAVREMDSNLRSVFVGAWQFLVATLLICAARVAWKARQDLPAQINRVIQHYAFGLWFAGFLTVMVFSRIFGSGFFWIAILQDRYARTVNRVAEESCELFGYLLLFFGCVEYLLQAKGARQGVPVRREM